MKIQRIACGVSVGVGMFAALTCCASAQANPGEVRHRNDCRLATQVLTLGRPADRYDWALTTIGTCADAGATVAHVWESPPTGEGELQRLYESTARIKDGRVFTAVFDVAEDRSQASLIRLAALGAVVTLVQPRTVLVLSDRRPLANMAPVEWDNVWSAVDHTVQLNGETPLPADAMEQAKGLVDRLEHSSGDTLVRDSAWWLSSLFGFGSGG